MEWWLQVIVSAGVGAVAGVTASVAAASRIARRSERGRRQEEARQRVLQEVRSYRAAVAGARGVTDRPPEATNPITEKAARDFTERVCRDASQLTRREQQHVRDRLGRLVGPTAMAIAEEIAHFPPEDRPHQVRSDAYLRVVDRVPKGEVLSKGLIGAANRYEGTRTDCQAAAEELDRLMDDLGAGWLARLMLRRT